LRLWPEILSLLGDADLVEVHPSKLEGFTRPNK
jgi:hypothetical protein